MRRPTIVQNKAHAILGKIFFAGVTCSWHNGVCDRSRCIELEAGIRNAESTIEKTNELTTLSGSVWVLRARVPTDQTRDTMNYSRPIRRKTKIVCTIGPASDSPEKLKALIEAGMDVARLNFSHGDHATHRQTLRNIRRLSSELGKQIGILQDLGGPKIRLGRLPVKERELETGKMVSLISAQASDSDAIPVNYPHLMEDVRSGDRILLADGTVELLVVGKGSQHIDCQVLVGGSIQSHKGVNLPLSDLRIPAFTDKDRRDLALGIEQQVDFVGLSFVRKAADVDPVLAVLASVEPRPMVIAKIEKPQAVERLEEILAKVDGVMVARGDLGVEMPLEDVPMIQKRIIKASRDAGKPVITATQMLRSMMENPRPTRAEAADVANAVLDGTDAVMLSDETAIGSYPVEAVRILNRVALATEPYLGETASADGTIPKLLPKTAAAIGRAACRLALDLDAAAIVATTSSGSTARLVARFRPPCPVAGLTANPATQRQLSLSWGVIPIKIEILEDTDQMFAKAKSWVLEHELARPGDMLVITAGVPVGVAGTTNVVKAIELAAD